MKITLLNRRLAGLAALLVAGTGFYALMAWQYGLWRDIALGTDYIPMAPLTAALFVFLGSVQGISLLWGGAGQGQRLVRAGAGLTFAVAVPTLLQPWLGFALPWDHWLVDGAAFAGKFPLGRMSPVTASVFILTAFALWGQSGRGSAHPWVRLLAAVAALTALVLGGIVSLSYAAGAPLFYSGENVPMALLTALCFMGLNGGIILTGEGERLLQRWREQDDAALVPAGSQAFTRRLLLIGCVLGALILAAGVFYLRREQATARLVEYEKLDAIARLKTEQISAWRNERLGEARFLLHTPAVRHDVAAFVAAPAEPAARRRLVDWLEPIRGGDRYALIQVLDVQGRPLLSIPAAPGETPGPAADALAAALRGRNPVFDDLRREAGQTASHLDLLVPIRNDPEGENGAPVAVILLRLDPRQFLYHLIQVWPLPSATAESLLVRREGDEVVYLSELRHLPGSALTFRRPINETKLSAARAARGEFGVFEGLDYRGVPVLSAIRPVPDTNWVLVAKVDLTEAYAAIGRDLGQTGTAVGLLLLAVTFAGAAIWRRRHAEFLRRALRAECDRNAMADRLAIVMQHANDIILFLDEQGRILEANERARIAYGYTLEEFRALPSGGLRPPSALDDFSLHMQQMATAEGTLFETMHRRKDGSVFPVEVSGRAITIEGRPHVLAIYRDITERKAHEREIERLNRIYFVISQVNQAVVRAKARDELFTEVCRVLVEIGCFRIAWIGWRDLRTQRIEPVASCGDEDGYVAGLHVSTNPEEAEGRGPSGISFREGRTYVCNDFSADPATGPWRERAARCGIQSSVAMPLRQEGVLVGLLTVYAAERDLFQSREVELLEETAGDVSFALDVFAGEQRRRAAETAVQASERRLQFLITATPAVIYSLRADGTFATNFLSPNVREVLGYPLEVAAAPDFWRQHAHPEDAPAANVAMAGIGQPGGPGAVVREYRFRHADGTWRWMHDETRVVRDAAGRPAELVGYWIDITDRKLSEAQLLKLSGAVEQSPTSIVITDLEGQIEYVTRGSPSSRATPLTRCGARIRGCSNRVTRRRPSTSRCGRP
jgi:PAS domain S-box-containing protein